MTCFRSWTDGVAARHWVATLILFTAAVFFLGLDARYLYGADEMRNAGIAADLTMSRYWTVPRLNGDYFIAMPPLFYWTAGAVMKVLGCADYAAKIPAGLFGMASVLGVFALARRLEYSSFISFLGAVSLATSFKFFELSRGCFSDTMLVAFVVWGVYGFYAMVNADRLRYRMRWFLFYTLMLAGSGLCHSFYVMLLLSGITLTWLAVCNLVCAKYRKPVWYGAVAGGLALALLIPVVWLMSVEKISDGNPWLSGWMYFFSYNGNFFLNPKNILGFYSPWGFVALIGLPLVIMEINRNPVESDKKFLLLSFLFLPLIFGFPLPAYAAMALFFGAALEILSRSFNLEFWEQYRGIRIFARVLGWLIIVFIPLMCIGTVAGNYRVMALFEWYILLAPLCSIAAAVLWLRRSPRSRCIAMLVALLGVMLMIDTYLRPLGNSRYSLKDIFRSAEVNLQLTGSTHIYLYELFEDEIVGAAEFYLKRRVRILDSKEEIEYLENHRVPAFIVAADKRPGFEQIGSSREVRRPVEDVRIGLYQLKKGKYNYAVIL